MHSKDLIAGEPGTDAFFALVRSGWKFRLFMLKNLPAAFFSGLRLEYIDATRAAVSIPFKWLTQNPFRSTYFASLSMAAEMSTGILGMAHIYKRDPAVSMLVTEIEGKFHKKATDFTVFECIQGSDIKHTIQQAVITNNPHSIKVLSTGYNKSKDIVAEFWITWSFKVKSKP